MQMEQFSKTVIAALSITASTAHASLVVGVAGAISPVYYSGSMSQWSENAVQAQIGGVSAFGTPNTPSFFSGTVNSVDASVIAQTVGFNSWNGLASPTGAYANEHGNAISVVASIMGDGHQQVSAAQIALAVSSGDPYNLLGFDIDAGQIHYGTDQYGSTVWGVRYGADGKFGGADDVVFRSGVLTQMMDAVFLAGFGNGLATGNCSGCLIGAQQQEIVNATGLLPDGITPYIMDVTVYDTSPGGPPAGSAQRTQSLGYRVIGEGEGEVKILNNVPAPEPGMLSLLALAFTACCAAKRKQSV